MPSSNLLAFCQALSAAKNVVVLTGAGVSAESGIPTFRGSGGLWRRYQAQNLATPQAFRANPSLVWEFYHYRREVALSKLPNPAHHAIAHLQKIFESKGKSVKVITQNIDELHQRAGSTDVVELHGSLFKTRCTKCHEIKSNYQSPICLGLKGRGAPDADATSSEIPISDLPKCFNCGGLLRPHIVWFGENLEKHVLDSAEAALDICDICCVVGTSSVVYPAAMFAPKLAERGIPVAEFNLESTPATDVFMYHFSGPCGTSLPEVVKNLEPLLK